MAGVKRIRDGDVGLLTLDEPSTLNAMTPDLLGDLAAAVDEMTGDAGVRALVLTGAGRGFCSGQNLRAFDSLGSDIVAGVMRHYWPAMRALRECRVPIVVAVNGVAAGGGFSLAMSGDIILAARSASFIQVFSRIGLVPDLGSTWLLPRLIGKARSVELSLMGERLPAEKALEWGLVNRVYDDGALMEETMKLAHELANGPTIALSLIRKLYWDSPENSFEEQLNLEFESQRIAGSAEDFKEGVTAFLEKRPAKFRGK